MSNKAHLRPHRKKRQASRTTGLLLLILFVALATAMAASGHALPAGRIIPLRRGRKGETEQTADLAYALGGVGEVDRGHAELLGDREVRRGVVGENALARRDPEFIGGDQVDG